MLNYAHDDPDRLDQLWETMDTEKGDMILRTEQYARWTLPYICAPAYSAGQAQDKGNVAIGPRLVNHLSNRIVDTMFPHDRPFFAVALTPETRARLKEELGDQGEAAFAEAVRSATSTVEESAMRKLRLHTYRPQAVEAVKHLLISGNALIVRGSDDRRQVFGVRDFCQRRRGDGEVYHVILREMKMFSSLPPTVQDLLRAQRPDLKGTTVCTLYTEFKLEGLRWTRRQAVDDILIAGEARFAPAQVPFLSLVWNLARGENYGRGLVEDHANAFHQVDVMTEALLDMVGIMADVKFLVDPASLLDVVELNSSERGSYHQGRQGDVSTPDTRLNMDINTIGSLIEALERELSQAFLLNSGVVRNADRVTAEEIRFLAMELESAFGGLYSRLALEWQQKEADYAVRKLDFNGTSSETDLKAFEVVVTTGLESLSREGQLENLRRAVADLQMLDAVPEEIRETIDPSKFSGFVFSNHAVRNGEFSYTPDQIASNRQQAMDQQERLLAMQTNAKVSEHAGKQAMQES